MDRPEVNTDSEDEAFESADEGDDLQTPSTDDVAGPKIEEQHAVPSKVQEKENVTSTPKAEDIPEDKSKGSEDSKKEIQEEKEEEDDHGDKTKEGEDKIEIGDQNQASEVSAQNPKQQEGAEKDSEVENSENVDDSRRDNFDSTVQSSENTNITKEPEKVDVDDHENDSADKQENKNEIEESMGSQSPIAQAMDRLALASDKPETKPSSEESASSSSWGWGGWGNVLSKATTSVSSMLETVETQLGIPNPVEMAKLVTQGETQQEKTGEAVKEQEGKPETESGAEEMAKHKEPGASDDSQGLGSWFSSLGVTNISKMVQTAGKDCVSSSLDALEFVGKKTMDVISKGDPGFRRKRTTLSQAIREAKERAENRDMEVNIQKDADIVTFSVEFDKFQGLAHLEALEMISHESDAEIEKILFATKRDYSKLFSVIKEKFESSLEDEESENKDIENFAEVINELISNLSLNVTATKLIASYTSTNAASLETRAETAKVEDLYAEAVTGFAEITARSVEIFHKIGEFMFLPDEEGSFLVKNRADSLRKICIILKAYVTLLSTRYAAILDDMSDDNSDDKAVSKLITDLYLEASNSSTYIEDSYHLLIPIFELTAARLGPKRFFST